MEVITPINQSLVIPVCELGEVGGARRIAARLSEKIGLSENESGKVSLVITEAGNNLVKHAGHGQLVVRRLTDKRAIGVEVLALDKGPGMSNLNECMRDGYSTAGSPGTGLGAISRLSTSFDVYSNPCGGTALMSRIWSPSRTGASTALEVGAICAAKEREQICGDCWSMHEHSGRSVIIVVDGLGHGDFAAEAAAQGVRIFQENLDRSPAEIIQRAHGALRSTRGAAMAIAEINFSEGLLRYVGIGNIASTIVSSGATRSLISHSGIVGHELRRVQEFVYPWPPGALLVMHSDGLQTRWTLAAYPGLAVRHAATIAGVLYRDFQRGRDDVTVVVVRERTQQR
jgi:anti-sigma regulatory factor (Ser/Thr protein kinase)